MTGAPVSVLVPVLPLPNFVGHKFSESKGEEGHRSHVTHTDHRDKVQDRC